jgi:ribosomal-protein-alanine N-acetyltransferase
MALMRKDGEGARRIDGEGVYLRQPELRDYQEWADLRDASRGYLTPWEPTWAQDETSRGSYRYKLRRYAEDARDDKAYALFIFREEDDALLGGVTLSNIRRGVAQMASLGYWAGEKFAKPSCGTPSKIWTCIASKQRASRTTSHRAAYWKKPASPKKALRART